MSTIMCKTYLSNMLATVAKSEENKWKEIPLEFNEKEPH